MERTPLNPHAFDEIKLSEEVRQKIIDRFSAHQIDTRQRVDTLVKLIFLLSGGALTISIGVFLRREAPQLTQRITELLQYSWYLLFFSLAASAIVLFSMITQGHHLGELWRRDQKTGENKIDESLVLKISEKANWSFGTAGFVSFLVGLGMLAFVSVAAIDASTENDLKAPSVIETFPPNGSIDVDPSINEIAVTFDEGMMDGNWSWAYTNKNKFPEMNGQPYYVDKFTKNILPVKLESNKEYEIWINSEKFKNFKDKAGNSATPFKWVFKTK